MGFGGIGVWQLLIVLVIVLLLFGTKRLRNLGGDLGNAVKGFKKAMKEPGKEKNEQLAESTKDDSAIDVESTREKETVEK